MTDALIVRGGWDGHHPVETTDLFVPYLRAQGYTVAISDSSEVYADRARMGCVDLIVQSVSMSSISHEACQGLCDAVAAGTGLVGWHGGIVDSYRDELAYLQLIGGQFVTHPGKDPSLRRGDETDNYLPHTVEFTDAGRTHPVTAGLDDFTLETEQYWVLHDSLIDVLATTMHPPRPWHPWHRPVVSPAVWTRTWGAGRIVVATPGHSVDVLKHPTVRTIIERGMLWATRAS